MPTALLAILFLLPVLAHADTVTVKGVTLQGTVKGLTDEAVQFETVYGSGAITIKYADIEAISTDGAIRVFHDGEATSGRVTGVKDGKVVIVPDGGGTEEIADATVDKAFSEKDIDESFSTWLKAELPYWNGELDTGLSLTRATVDTTAYAAGFRAERKLDPTRFLLLGRYTYSTQEEEGKSDSKLTDDAFGQIRGEYTFIDDWFVYGNGSAEYDAIQRLSIRGVPEAGIGNYLYKTKTSFWSVYGGGAWVYEHFFDETENDYVAVSMGTDTELALPYESFFRAGALYLPAVDDWANDYLIRSYASLTVPVWKMIAMKASVTNDYDATPAAGTKHNSLALLLGLSLLL